MYLQTLQRLSSMFNLMKIGHKCCNFNILEEAFYFFSPKTCKWFCLAL